MTADTLALVAILREIADRLESRTKRRPSARTPRGPRAPTPEDKASAAANLDEAAWARYQQRHGTKKRRA